MKIGTFPLAIIITIGILATVVSHDVTKRLADQDQEYAVAMARIDERGKVHRRVIDSIGAQARKCRTDPSKTSDYCDGLSASMIYTIMVEPS
jgi:CDGSH-type Zn-finger protein